MDTKIAFVMDALKGDSDFSALCRLYGISRQTGYLTLKRFREHGMDGLHPQSRAPHSSPQRWPDAMRQEVLALRQRYRWCGRKIRQLLVREDPDRELPAASTFDRWIHEAGLSKPRRRRQRPPAASGRPVRKASRSNQVFCVDFKGEFRLRNRDRGYCFPLTVTDAYSKYILACTALPGPLLAPTQACFEEIFATYGLPECIHSDNGTPFASTGLGRHSKLSVWWLTLGITVERSRPAHPQDNSAHERMHRTLKAAATKPPERSFAAQQRRFDAFVDEYNNLRPHDGLDGRVPGDLYEASERTLPAVIPDWRYPSYYEHRRVAPNGCIGWRGREWGIGKAFAGQLLGLVAQTEIRWRIYFQDLLIATLDEASKKIERHAAGLSVPNRRPLP